MTWYMEKGKDTDVVISTRVRMARNLKDYPFPIKLQENMAKEMSGKIRHALLGENGVLGEDFSFIEMNSLPTLEKNILVEKHLISTELAKAEKYCGLIISKDEKNSIFINEEDHIRIQCIEAGFDIENSFNRCNKIDDSISSVLEYSYDKNLGYLSSCPSNLGTGIRISVMLHLPGLVMTGYIKRILEACHKLGITARGMYGENTEFIGNMYQISNQITLGRTEAQLMENVKNITTEIIQQERKARKHLHTINKRKLEDKLMRSYGVMANSRIMSARECLKRISDMRLAVDLGIVKRLDSEKLNEIMIITKPFNIQSYVGRELEVAEKDAFRADIIRGKLK